MQAFVLAAGFGTRLRPLTLEIPKPLVPVAGVPLLRYHVVQLQKHGIDRIIINTHYLGYKITGYLADNCNFGFTEVLISDEQPEALGTSGALKKVEDSLDEVVLVVYGDNLTSVNYTNLIRRHQESGAVATIAVYQEPHIESKGMVTFSGDFISGFIEKPAPEQVVSHWANAGLYVISRAVIRDFVQPGFSDFGTNVFPALLAAHQKIAGYFLDSNELLIDIGTFENLAKAEQIIREKPDLFETPSL